MNTVERSLLMPIDRVNRLEDLNDPNIPRFVGYLVENERWEAENIIEFLVEPWKWTDEFNEFLQSVSTEELDPIDQMLNEMDYSETSGENPLKRVLAKREELWELLKSGDQHQLEQFLINTLPGQGMSDGNFKKFLLNIGYAMSPNGAIQKIKNLPFMRLSNYITNWVLAGLNLSVNKGTRAEDAPVAFIASLISEDPYLDVTIDQQIDLINRTCDRIGW